jgi:probable HAF family extracellular repeat protein
MAVEVRMRRIVPFVVAVVAALAVSAASGSAGSVQAQWVITDLGTLGGGWGEATALNERGEIVGDELGSDESVRLFLWRNGRMAALAIPDGESADAINSRGQIIGWTLPAKGDGYSFVWDNGRVIHLRRFNVAAINDGGQIAGSIRSSGRSVAALWEQGKVTSLGALPGSKRMSPYDMNERGQVVGSSVSEARDGTTVERGFLWSDGQMTDLGTLAWHATATDPVAINAGGQVAGDGRVAPNNRHAFLWQDGTMTDLGTLGGRYCRVTGLNDRGEVVGWSRLKVPAGAAPIEHAFLWSKGRMIDLGTLGGKWSRAIAINSQGRVIGSSATRTGESHAFVWQGGAMTDLGTLGGKGSDASAINNYGQIVGAAAPETGAPHAVLWTLRSG